MAPPILAKPSGISLEQHTKNVWRHAKAILDAYPFLEKKYRELTGKELRPLLKSAVQYHDAGKAFKQWQQAVQQDYALYRQWRVESGLPPEARDARENARDFVRFDRACRERKKSASPNLVKAGVRHEFASLDHAEKAGLGYVERAAIAAHHGKLGVYFAERRWFTDAAGAFKKHWIYFHDLSRDLGHRLTRQEKQEKAILERYTVSAVRALLQLADTRASREEAGNTLVPLQTFDYTFGKPSYRLVQEQALGCANRPISILRAPTGSGKTDGSLLWGKAIICPEDGLAKADRLVIAMPTRFTSNALAIGVASSVSETGLYHSSAWYNRYGDINPAEKDFAREKHKLARLLVTPVTVCTIDHLLIALTGTKEDHHATFFFLANAAVVLDEADFYDPFVQSNIQVLISTLRLLKVPILIMSATVPDSARRLYGVADPIIEVGNEKEPVRKILSIGEVELARDADPESEDGASPLSFPEHFRIVIGEMLEAGQGIVYVNTVARGLAVYEHLLPLAKERDIPITFYHSRFTEPDKKGIEGRLLDQLGEKAWKAQSVRGIAILTQIGEMSINISATIMYSDLCPWDRLAQRLGRLDRFLHSSESICYVGIPTENALYYPAPYGTYDRKSRKWTASEAWSKTLEGILAHFSEATKITSQDLVEKVNNLYPEPESLSGKAQANQNELISRMGNNWLVVPNNKVEEEDRQAGLWFSRDIPTQVAVHTKFPEFSDPKSQEDDYYSFPDYDSFRTFQLENNISCPAYMVEKARKSGQVVQRRYFVGDNRENPEVVVIADNYDPHVGLARLGLGARRDTAARLRGESI